MAKFKSPGKTVEDEPETKVVGRDEDLQTEEVEDEPETKAVGREDHGRQGNEQSRRSRQTRGE